MLGLRQGFEASVGAMEREIQHKEEGDGCRNGKRRSHYSGIQV